MRKSILQAALALAIAATSSFAGASTLFSTADLNDFSSSSEPGAYIISNTNFVGATFHLSSASDISAIGGYFTQYSNDNIFGAILASGTSWASLATSALADVVFSGSGYDQTIALNSPLHLAAGDYQIVFGSGLFGATGDSALVDSQYTLGNPVIKQSFDAGQHLSALSSQDVRITVLGSVSPAPEPEGIAMLLAGMGIVSVLARRRRS